MNIAVLSVAGAILGLGLLGGPGALLGAGLGALAGWSLALQGRVQRLERAAGVGAEAGPDRPGAAEPERTGRPPAPPRSGPRFGAAPSASRTRAARAPEQASRASSAQAAHGDTVGAAPVGPGASAPAAAAPSLGPTLLDRAVDTLKRWLTTGNVPVKLGVVLSTLGIGFLVREAAERDWLVVPLPLRLAGAAAFGIVLLVVGWRLRERRRVYALSLQGGGIAIVYVTVYAAFALYALLPAAMAFTLLVAVTGAGAALAVLQDARSLAVLSIAGGFLAPIVASTGAGSHVVLFSYYAILNAGVLGIAWFKAWRELNVLGFVFTFAIGTLWGVLEYVPAQLATTEPFLILFVAMYVLIPVLFAERQAPELKGLVDGTLVFGVPLVGFGLQTQLLGDSELGLAASALGLAGVYVALASWLYARLGAARRLLIECYLSLSVVFVTIAIPLALDARWTSVAWSLQGAAMVWLGLRQSRRLALAAGVALQGLAAAGYGFALFTSSAAVPVLNGGFLGAVLIATAAMFSSWVFDRVHAERAHVLERVAAAAMLAWGALWWIGAGVVEIARFVPGGYELPAVLLLAAASGAGAMVVARSSEWERIAHLGALVLPGMALVLAAQLFVTAHPLARLGWLAWPLALATHYAYLYCCSSRPAWLARAWHVAGFWLLAGLTALEAYRLASLSLGGIWPEAAALTMVTALLVAALRARERIRWPLAAEWRSYLAAGCGGLVAALGVAAVNLNVSSAGDAPPLPYVPLLNPLELASVLALLAAARWHALLDADLERAGSARWPGVLALVLACGFLLTMVVARTVHHWTGVPFEYTQLVDSNVLQAALSIVWGSAALIGMIAGAARAQRAVWLGGAALMGAVVVKLFVVELGDTGTLTRIVSFLGVGVLLLVVGFFAPVPPRSAQAQASRPGSA